MTLELYITIVKCFIILPPDVLVIYLNFVFVNSGIVTIAAHPGIVLGFDHDCDIRLSLALTALVDVNLFFNVVRRFFFFVLHLSLANENLKIIVKCC